MRLGAAPPDRGLRIRADQSRHSDMRIVRREADKERFKLAKCESRRVDATHRWERRDGDSGREATGTGRKD